jgi:NAD(P)-dependent dehydrogenase (short-subunit alcohol dehydrogenase family)
MKRLLLGLAAGAAGYLAYRALKPQYDFKYKHVLITGGARGLGLVLARRLADQGAHVSICSRTADQVATAEADLRTRTVAVYAAECDITDREQMRAFVADARRIMGPVDVLINNAGVIEMGPLEEMLPEDFERSLNTHFWAVLHTCREVIPEMKERRAGRIVNIASIGGEVAVPHLLPYSTGKFALVGFSTGLRAELARHGIVVTTVSPGLMRTGSHVNAQFKGQFDKEYAWFSLANATPGLSMSVEAAARKIIRACAVGDAEVVLGLPAKLAVAARALCPNLTADVFALVNRYLLPDPGGIGPAMRSGLESKGKLPEALTVLSDRASERNNELTAKAVLG